MKLTRWDNYEVGFKSQWMDRRVTLNVSAFRMIWDNIQATRGGDDDDVWWLVGNINGGKAVSKGIEVEFDARISPQLKFDSSFFTGKANYVDPVLYSGEVVVEAGTKMSFAPSFKAAMGMEYTVPDVAFGADMWMRYDMWFQGKMLKNSGDPYYLPSYNSSAFKIGLGNESWDVALSIDNLWNQKYLTNTNAGTHHYGEYWGTERYRTHVNRVKPREFTLRFSKKF